MFNPFFMRNLGIYYMLIASFYYAITGAFAKILSTEVGSIEIVFFRNFIGLLFLLVILRKSAEISKGGHIFLLAFRGIMGILALVAFFYNVAHIGLARVLPFKKQHRFLQRFCHIFS